MSRKISDQCSHDYLATVLQLTKYCPRRNCRGLLTEVWVQYEDGGEPIKEKECSKCGKIMRGTLYKRKCPTTITSI